MKIRRFLFVLGAVLLWLAFVYVFGLLGGSFFFFALLAVIAPKVYDGLTDRRAE